MVNVENCYKKSPHITTIIVDNVDISSVYRFMARDITRLSKNYPLEMTNIAVEHVQLE